MKNKPVNIDKISGSSAAEKYFFQIAGILPQDEKHQGMKEQALKIRTAIEDRIDVKAVYSYYEDVFCNQNEITIAGQVFSCSAFAQIDPAAIEGAYVYMITAGDYALDESPAGDQLLADIWGTAFVEAGREYLRAEFEKNGVLSDNFGPGFYGLELTAVHNLAKLVDHKSIGIEVKDNGIMIPVKSCAGIVFSVNDAYKKMDEACADCLGNEVSCNLCSVKNKKKKLFQCTGECYLCDRCKGTNQASVTNDKKAEMVRFPEDFKADGKEEGYGVAFDIGTTTVVGMLWDLRLGTYMDAAACTNPQNEFGLDVLSRIAFCGEAPQNLHIMRNKILQGLNNLIEKLCVRNDIKSTQICKAALSGNTAMSHIFAGYSTQSLAAAPFEPAYEGNLELSGEEAGLNIASRGEVLLLPNIAGHVGGDITAGLLAARVLQQEELILFLDIGTNGEILLLQKEKGLTCSTAAGPAFEGASVYQGMRAMAGAIEKIQIKEEDVFFKTVENCEPVGICGSGLIDAVAQLLRSGVIDKTGRILSREDFAKKYPENMLAERIREQETGREFVLVSKAKKEDIVITQKDIREVQLAKGVIRAGVSILLNIMGKREQDIEKIIIAGAFGNFIDKRSASAIGLLPKVSPEKVIFVGNAAGAGVSMILVSEKEKKLAMQIPEKVEHIELAEQKDFQQVYLEKMSFEIK